MTPSGSEFVAGWRILLACFLGIAVGVSSLYFYSLGIFLKPLATEFGWSRGEASVGVLVGTVCAAAMAFPVGRLVDRVGSVPVALASLALLAAGFASLGVLTSGLASFIVLTAILSLLTAGSTAIPYTRLIVAAFRRHRGLALGLALSGTGLGAMLVPAVLTPFIAEHGWRSGYFALSGAILVCLPVIGLLLAGTGSGRPVPAPSGAPEVGNVIRTRAFWSLGVIFFCASVAVLGTIVHFVPMLTDAGFSPARAGETAALIGLAAIAGRLLAGLLLDRMPAGLVTAGLFGLAAAGLCTLAIGGTALAVPGALITGLAIGAEADLLSYLVGRHFPQAVYGRAYGGLYGLFLLGGAVGPVLSGYVFDLTGSYHQSLLLASALLIFAALSTLAFEKFVPARAEC